MATVAYAQRDELCVEQNVCAETEATETSKGIDDIATILILCVKHEIYFEIEIAIAIVTQFNESVHSSYDYCKTKP